MLVSRVCPDVAFGELVTDLTKPGLATDELLIDRVVSDNIHVIPPSVVEIMPPLLVHSHVDQAVHGEMESVG